MNSIELKSSFDRFGSDLIELILSYLTIDDKFRFECLSKQIQSVIYTKQKSLIIASEIISSPKPVDGTIPLVIILPKTKTPDTLQAPDDRLTADNVSIKLLDPVLRKLELLRQIEFRDVTIDGQLLAILNNNCRFLQTIEFKSCLFYISSSQMCQYSDNWTKSLTSLAFISCVWKESDNSETTYEQMTDTLAEILRKTTSLQRFHYFAEPRKFFYFNYLELLTNNSDIYLKNLTEIDISYGIPYESIKEFFEIYCKQIKSMKLSLRLCHSNAGKNQLNPLLIQLSTFRSLETLSLTISHIMGKEFIDSGIKQLTENLVKLKKFEFKLFTPITGDLLKTTRVITVIKNMDQLTDFKLICLRNNRDPLQEAKLMGSTIAENFSQPLNLSNLELHISCLNDNHLKSIEQCFPRLKTVSLSTDRVLRVSCLKYLSKLPELTHLKLNAFSCRMNPITDLAIENLLKCCPKIQTIVLNLNTKITENSVKCFIEFANKRPKILFKLMFVTKNKLSIDYQNFVQNNCIINDITNEFFNKYSRY